jgi:hypothetical protein
MRSGLQFPLSYRKLNARSSKVRCYLRRCTKTYSYEFKVIYFLKYISLLKILGSTLEIFLLLGLPTITAQRWGVSNGTAFMAN